MWNSLNNNHDIWKRTDKYANLPTGTTGLILCVSAKQASVRGIELISSIESDLPHKTDRISFLTSA